MTSSVSTPIDYQALFRALPGLYLLLAPDGTILDNSDAHVASSLLPRAQAVGRDIFVAYPAAPESQRALRESHDYVRAHRQPHTMDVTRYDLQRPAEQGGGFEERYWQITHYPILDRAGELRFILQLPQDVTEQHRSAARQRAAERSLVEVRAQAEFILENLPILVAATPPDGPSNYFNRRWREFTGRSTEALLHNGWAECVHPDDAARLMDWRKTQSITPDESQIEFRLRRHDGVYRWMLARSLSHFGPDGQLRQRVSCSVDIQDQKDLVQELLDTTEQQALLSEQAHHAFELAQRQRDTFHQFFNQAPAMICILRGPDHRFEFTNLGYQALFPHRQLVGRTVREAIPEVVEQGFTGILDGVYRTGETFYGNEIAIQLDRDGAGHLRETFFNFTYQQFRENDVPAGIMVFAFDVTEFVLARRRLEEYYRTGGQADAPH